MIYINHTYIITQADNYIAYASTRGNNNFYRERKNIKKTAHSLSDTQMGLLKFPKTV